MKKIIFKFVIILSLFAARSFGQQAEIKFLKIGDSLPPSVLKALIGSDPYEKTYQGKSLIINFWATWCMPCLRELPLLDSIAGKNAGHLNVIAVTYEDRAKVQAFLEKRTELKLSHIALATDDKLLHAYFPHSGIPHNIWIDSHGVITHITGSDEINHKNIDGFLKNQNLAIRVKKDLVDYDLDQTFHLLDSNFRYRSILTGFADGLNGGSYLSAAWHPARRMILRDFEFNVSRAQLLWSAINRKVSSRDFYNLLKIETKDSTRFFWPKECPLTFAKSKFKDRRDWINQNTNCYQMSMPYAVQDTVFFDYMLNDLVRAFNISVSKVNKKIPCAVITKNKGFNFGKVLRDTSFIDVNEKGIKARNVSVFRLFEYLNELVKPDLNAIPLDPPYIDQSKISGPIDIDLTFENGLPDYKTIKLMLEKKYGLVVKTKMYDYPITVVKDLEL